MEDEAELTEELIDKYVKIRSNTKNKEIANTVLAFLRTLVKEGGGVWETSMQALAIWHSKWSSEQTRQRALKQKGVTTARSGSDTPPVERGWLKAGSEDKTGKPLVEEKVGMATISLAIQKGTHVLQQLLGDIRCQEKMPSAMRAELITLLRDTDPQPTLTEVVLRKIIGEGGGTGEICRKALSDALTKEDGAKVAARAMVNLSGTLVALVETIAKHDEEAALLKSACDKEQKAARDAAKAKAAEDAAKAKAAEDAAKAKAAEDAARAKAAEDAAKAKAAEDAGGIFLDEIIDSLKVPTPLKGPTARRATSSASAISLSSASASRLAAEMDDLGGEESEGHDTFNSYPRMTLTFGDKDEASRTTVWEEYQIERMQKRLDEESEKLDSLSRQYSDQQDVVAQLEAEIKATKKRARNPDSSSNYWDAKRKQCRTCNSMFEVAYAKCPYCGTALHVVSD
jgi:hypothetical protein